MFRRKLALITLGWAAWVCWAAPAQAITVGELDSFSTNLEGWSQGHSGSATIGISRATTGGPAGASDAYMRIISGGGSDHSKLVAFNQTPAWTGSYIAAGVSRIAMDVNNQGATDLKLRIALGTGTSAGSGSWFASASAINVPAGSGWISIHFPLSAGNLTSVAGPGTYNTVLSNIGAIRLLHSDLPDNRGAPITASLGVDNIQASAAAVSADFDRNGSVNGADLGQWRERFGVDHGADADGDGDSDGDDFLIWQRQLGATTSEPLMSAVPEPITLSLVWWLVPSLLFSQRRATAGRQHTTRWFAQ